MFQSWMVGLMLAFVMRQVAKFGGTTDWAKVKADLGARVAKLIPGTWFDTDAVALSDRLVDAVAATMQNEAFLNSLKTLIAKEKWEDAGKALQAALLKEWCPDDEQGKRMLANLENFHFDTTA